MRLIIAGSKTFTDYTRFKNEIDEFMVKNRHDDVEYFLTGGDPGTEELAAMFAKDNNIPLKTFLPDTETFGEEAEIVRDTQIIDDGTTMIVFYDGSSTGHPRKQDIARKKGMNVIVID